MDQRTLRDKLRDMAERGTPPEQAIARAKLEALGPEPERLGASRRAFIAGATAGAAYTGGDERAREALRRRVAEAFGVPPSMSDEPWGWKL